MSLSRDILRDLYRDMLRSRRVELRIEGRYFDDEMKTPIHLYIGQEAIAAGVCAHLTERDPIFTTYRSHGQYLSKGGDLRKMIAELHCKETGCSRGRGGSMHLTDLDVAHYGSSAIVAGGIPIATGMALAGKMKGDGTVTVTFFGDGATDEGVFYESINFAMLKRLPIVYILENNQWAVCSHVSKRKVGECIYHRADPELLLTRQVDGNSVTEVYAAAEEAIAHARAGNGPALIECHTYRLRSHNGAGSDTRLGHRTDAEIEAWVAKCPLASFRDYLIREEVMAQSEMDALEDEIEAEIDEAFAFAQASPTPAPEDLLVNVYRS
ncbi:MAG: thiamine pyrophosphate-dependent dehydrogenase E1 component subunit alpha [Candidatus Hydrogenedentes bacterium]|nr:thiamine pyrophosphate-dependent dehydrogenase E1 component subunit alpha [Candidatus Hydrogenedentota bacterium]